MKSHLNFYHSMASWLLFRITGSQDELLWIDFMDHVLAEWRTQIRDNYSRLWPPDKQTFWVNFMFSLVRINLLTHAKTSFMFWCSGDPTSWAKNPHQRTLAFFRTVHTVYTVRLGGHVKPTATTFLIQLTTTGTVLVTWLHIARLVECMRY